MSRERNIENLKAAIEYYKFREHGRGDIIELAKYKSKNGGMDDAEWLALYAEVIAKKGINMKEYIKFTYATDTFSLKKDDKVIYLGTYDMIKNQFSDKVLTEAIKNAGQWTLLESQDKISKMGSKIAHLTTTIEDKVATGGEAFKQYVLKVYKTPWHTLSDETLRQALKDFKKKGKHLGDTPKKIKHLGDGEIDPSALLQFTGTINYYKHLSGYKYTDGIHYLVEHGAAWLVDKILFTTKHTARLQLQDYQEFTSWKLTVNDDHTAILVAEDGNGHKIYSEKINYTDFPLKEISLWFEGGVLLLPSEH